MVNIAVCGLGTYNAQILNKVNQYTMDFWRKINSDAVKLFNAQQYYLSSKKYSEGVERAYFLYNRWQNHKESLNCLVASLQGLTESHIQLKEFEKAGGVILKGHRLVKNLLKFDNDSDLERKEALIKTQKQLTSYIAYLLAEYPQIEVCEQCYKNIFGYNFVDSMLVTNRSSRLQ